MTSQIRFLKSLVPVLIMAICLGSVRQAWAQSSQTPAGLISGGTGAGTGMRAAPTPPTVNSDGTTSTGYPATNGCVDSVNSAITNTSNYSYTQSVAVVTNTVQQPTSFSSCLGGLLKQAQSLNNMFSTTGLSVNFSFGELLQKLANQAIQQTITQLENQACQDAEKAAQGVFGSIGTINFNNLINPPAGSNGVLIQLNPTVSGTTSSSSGVIISSSSGGASSSSGGVIITSSSGGGGSSSSGSSSSGSSSSGGKTCPPGTELMPSGRCLSTDVCPPGSTLIGGTCISNKNIVCPSGYYLADGVCLPNGVELP